MHLQRRVAKQAGKLRFRDDLRRHKVQDKNFQRADVLRNRAGLRHDEDILTLQGSSCRQIVRYLNGHGVPSGLFGGKRLIEVGNQVVRILKAAGQPHKVWRNTRCGKLAVVHLAVRRAGGMQAACPRIGDVRLDGGKLQVAHKPLCGSSAALDAERNDAAGAVRQIFLRQLEIAVARAGRSTSPTRSFRGPAGALRYAAHWRSAGARARAGSRGRDSSEMRCAGTAPRRGRA